MNLLLTSNVCLIVYLLLSIIDLFFAFDENIRFHKPLHNQRLNYSYVNLKKLPGYKVTADPYFALTVQNQSVCIKECLKTNGICRSINLRTVSVDVHECEILSTDIYFSKNLTIESGYNHFVIKVCMY